MVLHFCRCKSSKGLYVVRLDFFIYIGIASFGIIKIFRSLRDTPYPYSEDFIRKVIHTAFYSNLVGTCLVSAMIIFHNTLLSRNDYIEN